MADARTTLAWLMWCYSEGYTHPDDRAILDRDPWWTQDASKLHPDDVILRDQLLIMADEILAALAVEPVSETENP